MFGYVTSVLAKGLAGKSILKIDYFLSLTV